MRITHGGRNYVQGRDLMPGDQILVKPSTGEAWIKVTQVKPMDTTEPKLLVHGKFILGAAAPPPESRGEIRVEMGPDAYVEVP